MRRFFILSRRNRRQKSLDRRRAVDLHTTVIHEVGHLTVLRHFGSEGWIEFELNPSPQPGDMTVLGSMHYTQRPVSLVQRAAFGVAGVAAEVMAFENDITPTEIYQYIQTDYIEPSETDWELIGGHIGRAVPLAHAVLTAHWDDFQTEASVYLRNWAGRLGVDMRAHPFFAGP